MKQPLACFPSLEKSLTLNHNVFPAHPGASYAIALQAFARQHNGLTCVITDTASDSEILNAELSYLLADTSIPILHFPEWETLPYDRLSPFEDLISDRIRCLAQLPDCTQHSVLICTASSLINRLPPISHIAGQALSITCGQTIALDQFCQNCIDRGYQMVQQVHVHGEISRRGAIVDIFPMGSDQAYRIEWFDDIIDTIRILDCDSQRSFGKQSAIACLPTAEVPNDPASISQFRVRWRDYFKQSGKDALIYEAVSAGRLPAGIEYYLPLYFTHTTSLIDFLPKQTAIFTGAHWQATLSDSWALCQERYARYHGDRTHPLLRVADAFHAPESVVASLKKRRFASMNSLHQSPAAQPLPCEKPSNATALEHLGHWVELICAQLGTLIITCDTPRRMQTIQHMLTTLGHTAEIGTAEGLGDKRASGIVMITSPLRQGFYAADDQIMLITDNDCFQFEAPIKPAISQAAIDPSTLIKHLSELKLGDYVVHRAHGVGQFTGLEHVHAGQNQQEMIVIQYADNDLLYVPVTQLSQITHYSIQGDHPIKCHRLGGKEWKKQSEQAQKQIIDLAALLLNNESQRKSVTGVAFPPPNDAFHQFASEVPFAETADQSQAIIDVLADLQSPQPMDRLVCGDVGFGKTEVALQASFFVVQHQYQVILLAPTTVLAEQHYETLCDRLHRWPINVALLSRSTNKTTTESLIADFASNKIDILIGTHKLLTQAIDSSRLGLIIIDEEQRFGVHQKELLRALKHEVNCLTLSATPIPRTLNMALSGSKAISIIATPPMHRLSVKTLISEYQSVIVEEAVNRECKRGGQVYYLHNDIRSIQAVADRLHQQFPTLKIAIAHGQMGSKALTQVMRQFAQMRIQLLVCTSIIESGIDVPSANTMIIDRADQFGLSQLHQLRGRVGRSHHQAYAYLFTRPEEMMTADAKKRLAVLARLQTLGSGFMIAHHDCEIRGAGSLLGKEQSGQMQSLGSQLYMEYLTHAINELKNHRQDPFAQQASPIDIRLCESALLPESYIANPQVRLTLYKRLADCNTRDAINAIEDECLDRFGPLPDPAITLLRIQSLRIMADALGIERIIQQKDHVFLHMCAQPHINRNYLLKQLQSNPEQFKLARANQLKVFFRKTLATTQDVFRFIEEHLLALYPDQ